MTTPKTINVDGVEYAPVATPDPDNRKIVRSRDAGVFFGTIIERDPQDGSHILMADARRIWYWDGAASLSELAVEGTSKPASCKFPTPVARVELFNVCEILDVTEKAAKSIDGVKVWKS